MTEEISDGSSLSNDDDLIESSVNLQPNLSDNYLGMILCFEITWDMDKVDYSLMTSGSNILERGHHWIYGSSIVIVPRSIFRVTDADHHWIYKSSIVETFGM